jgi:hypothetical protein
MIACWKCQEGVNRLARALRGRTTSGRGLLHVLRDHPMFTTGVLSILRKSNLKPHFEMVPHWHQPRRREGRGSRLRRLYVPRRRRGSKRFVLDNRREWRCCTSTDCGNIAKFVEGSDELRRLGNANPIAEHQDIGREGIGAFELTLEVSRLLDWFSRCAFARCACISHLSKFAEQVLNLAVLPGQAQAKSITGTALPVGVGG